MSRRRNSARSKQTSHCEDNKGLGGKIPPVYINGSKGNNDYKEYRLAVESELRFEVHTKGRVSVEMTQGLAEIFGREIILNTKYDFSQGARIAVFTWHGCLLRLYGKPEYSYISTDTPLIQYINVHGALEEKRNIAEKDKTFGPNVMIVGAHDVGKSTLARLLLNYVARMPNRKQIFVDLDIEDNLLTLPGSLSAVLVERPLPFEASYFDTALVYHYGHSKLTSNPLLYDAIISRLAFNVRRKLKKSTKTSGIVINTGGYKQEEGCEHLLHIAKEFAVELILVLDNEKLKHDLLEDDYVKSIDIILLQKSAGVVKRCQKSRYESMDMRIRQYFYGINHSVHPHSFQLHFGDIKIYKVDPGHEEKAETSPPPRTIRVEPSTSLLHCLLAMSHECDPDKMATATVIGFIAITHVNMDAKLVTVLSPRPRPLPGSTFLLSEKQFYDH